MKIIPQLINTIRVFSWLSIASFFLAISGFPADVTTYHNDNSHTGVNPDEIALTPDNVNVNSFGLIFNAIIGGQVYAQPLYVSSVPIFSSGISIRHNLVIVATELDNVYAFDADSGVLIWNKSLLGTNEVPADSICSDLTPNNGVTGTPVIDREMLPYGQIYLVAMSKTTDTGTYHQRLHVLDLSAGRDIVTPVTIQASYPGSRQGSNGQGLVIFDPAKQRQRAALLLANQNNLYRLGRVLRPQGSAILWVDHRL